MKTTQSRLLTINEVCRIDAKAFELLTVESGVAWVTEAGCDKDLFLQPGDSLTIATSGLTVVEGLSVNTRIHLHPRASSTRQSIGFAVQGYSRLRRVVLERIRKFALGNEVTATSL